MSPGGSLPNHLRRRIVTLPGIIEKGHRVSLHANYVGGREIAHLHAPDQIAIHPKMIAAWTLKSGQESERVVSGSKEAGPGPAGDVTDPGRAAARMRGDWGGGGKGVRAGTAAWIRMRISKRSPFTWAGIAALLALGLAAPAGAGGALPTRPLALLDGGTLDFQSLKGKVVVIRFLASW